MDKKKKTYIPLIFSEKQIIEIKPHSDPNMIDKNTGKVSEVAKILLASVDKRANHKFGIDNTGIDRDTRGAYINIPASFIKKDTSRSGRCYVYLDAEREYIVHFSGQKTGELNQDKNPIYDAPESAKVGAQELRHCFGLKDYIAKEAQKEVPKDISAKKKKEVTKTPKGKKEDKQPKKPKIEKKDTSLER